MLENRKEYIEKAFKVAADEWSKEEDEVLSLVAPYYQSVHNGFRITVEWINDDE